MTRTTVTALVLLLAGVPLAAQQRVPAADYWVGMGRFTTGLAGEAPKEPIDLGGRYDLSGVIPGDTATWTSAISLKRVKTVETPQGGKINLYEYKYDGIKDVQGLAMHVGRRLYIAYGSKNIGLGVGAPLVLTDNEAAALHKTHMLAADAWRKNSKDDNRVYGVKNSPWFAGVKHGDDDMVNFDHTKPVDASGFYSFWMAFDATWGEYFLWELDGWGAGESKVTGYVLKQGNQTCGTGCWFAGRMSISPSGSNWYIDEWRSYPSKYEIDGTAHQLPDGTVVWVIGGGPSAGAGWYDVVDGKLTGRYWAWGGDQLGTHTLVPSAEVLAKNAAFFAGP